MTPLVCKSCKGTGRWDMGTEDEGPCGADHCHEGILICMMCMGDSADDEPAVGTFRDDHDDDLPLCRRHLERALNAQAEECRGDYMRDMQKDGG